MKINISDDENNIADIEKGQCDSERGKSGNMIQSAAKRSISSTLTQEEIFRTLDDLDVFRNADEFQKHLDGLSPQSRKTYFITRFPNQQMASSSTSQLASSNVIATEVPCSVIETDQKLELVETRPIVQQVVSVTAGNKEKNKRKRKSQAAQVALNGVIAKLNECFNEINSVWAQNPRNTSLSLIPGEILKVRELVSDELEKFTDSDD